MYTFGGRVPVQDYFLNTAFEGIGRSEATVFSKEQVDNYSEIEVYLAALFLQMMLVSTSDNGLYQLHGTN